MIKSVHILHLFFFHIEIWKIFTILSIKYSVNIAVFSRSTDRKGA